eukprot:TRINITY_DN9689_c0_g1_i1.p1 TRINITY_DN9689_c0_g1~~TRINITY_DN9689_c0_g1_i1.p1  ORF type:complete len:278 (+),score=66.35 TRINITY_DN9689_c0_g1_i1:417-1250(+)
MQKIYRKVYLTQVEDRPEAEAPVITGPTILHRAVHLRKFDMLNFALDCAVQAGALEQLLEAVDEQGLTAQELALEKGLRTFAARMQAGTAGAPTQMQTQAAAPMTQHQKGAYNVAEGCSQTPHVGGSSYGGNVCNQSRDDAQGNGETGEVLSIGATTSQTQPQQSQGSRHEQWRLGHEQGGNAHGLGGGQGGGVVNASDGATCAGGQGGGVVNASDGAAANVGTSTRHRDRTGAAQVLPTIFEAPEDEEAEEEAPRCFLLLLTEWVFGAAALGQRRR